MSCFVDTSALLAVMDKDDEFHIEAKALWERLTEQQVALVATNYVVLETVALLQHRIGMPAVRRFHADIMPVLTIEWISSGQHVQGMAALLAADRRNLSLVDCISFDAMRRRSLRQVFAFDKHFEEQGFTTELST